MRSSLTLDSSTSTSETYILTIAAGETSVDVTVAADDDTPTITEGLETLTATIDSVALTLIPSAGGIGGDTPEIGDAYQLHVSVDGMLPGLPGRE